ncbi:MAG TPA: TlpA disulfide reductase family protein [Micavibrio sp.]
MMIAALLAMVWGGKKFWPAATEAPVEPTQEQTQEPAQEVAQEEELQPALALKDLDDQITDLAARHPGKTLLINYWATWCPPCITEIPSLLQVKTNRQSDQFDVVFINLDFPKDATALKALMKRIGFENLDTLYMYDARQWSELNGRGLPISVLVSPEGRILRRFVGGMDWTSEAGDDFLKGVPKNR